MVEYGLDSGVYVRGPRQDEDEHGRDAHEGGPIQVGVEGDRTGGLGQERTDAALQTATAKGSDESGKGVAGAVLADQYFSHGQWIAHGVPRMTIGERLGEILPTTEKGSPRLGRCEREENAEHHQCQRIAAAKVGLLVGEHHLALKAPKTTPP